MTKTASSGASARKGGLLLAALLLAAAAATAVQAETARLGPHPDIEDLRFYRACNRIAETELLGFEEAGLCSRAFLRIILAFVPDVTLEAFDKLPPPRKLEINTLGYLRYREWSKANASWLAALDDEAPATAATD